MKKNLIYFILLLYAVICVFTIIYFNGTCGADDSIVHYLFARYAPHHPELYFDHWAKPVFVLLASPFAQMGFNGVKIFNTLVSLLTIFYTYKTAEELKLKNAIVVAIILIFSPLNYILTFSGLTEPLFALFTITGIYLCTKQKYFGASILISFLPYVRSEGLIILGVFILFFTIKKTWRVIPVLLTGSICYSLAGYFVYHDLLWVFTKIPYATAGSVYGSGPITHFAEQYIYVVGVPIYILFWVGLITMGVNMIKKKINAEELVLVLFTFGAFFIAHSLFWFLGIFNSAGLKRVMIGVMPIAAMIALYGFNIIPELLFRDKKKSRFIFEALLIIYIVIFPLTPNPAAIQWKDDMGLRKDQLAIIDGVNFLTKENKLNHFYIYDHHYFSLALNIDPFDGTKHKKITRQSISEMKSGDIAFWDTIYTEPESDIRKTELDSMPDLVSIYNYKFNEYGKDIIFTAYEKK